MKKSKILLLIITLLLLVGSIFLFTKNNTNNLVIKNLKVGKADCAILYYQDKAAIIDTGEIDDYEKINKELDRSNIKTIDFMILSHFDKDHVGSAKQIIDNYDVKKIYVPDYESDNEILEYLKDKDVEYVSYNNEFKWIDIDVELYPASNKEEIINNLGDDEIDNDLSLICKLTYKENKFLFAGDIEKVRVKQVLNDGIDLTCDYLKYPHHGDHKKAYRDLLEYVNPKYVVVCDSNNNPMEDKTIDMLNEFNINYFETNNTNVITVSNGKTISISYE